MQSASKGVFEQWELKESIVKKLDTMQQIHNLLGSMPKSKLSQDYKKDMQTLKKNVRLGKAYLSGNIIDLIANESWRLVLVKWKRFMINPEVTKSTLNGLSSRHSPDSFVQLVLSRLHAWTVDGQVAIIANMINLGLFDLLEEAMRKHYQNHTVVMASIVFLLDWFLMMNRVHKECMWHLKIVGGVVKEIEDEMNGTPNEEWYMDLVEIETGEEPTEDMEYNDRLFEPYFKTRDTIDDFVEEYKESPDQIDIVDSEIAQKYMDQCTKNGMVYQTLDLRPIVHQVMQWLHTITREELPDNGPKQIRALALLQTALKTNNRMRAGLIECGIVPFVVSRIAFNNDKAMLIRKRELDAQVPCAYTPCQFACYSLIYEFMTETDNDVIVAALSKAGAITVILDTLKEASSTNSPFEFEFASNERKYTYDVGDMNCYKALENGVTVHNISELAFVVMSKMCTPNPFTNDSRCYRKNMAYFHKNSEDDLLKMGLLSFTNIKHSTKAQHNSMSDDDHDERLRNLSNLESMVMNPKSQ